MFSSRCPQQTVFDVLLLEQNSNGPCPGEAESQNKATVSAKIMEKICRGPRGELTTLVHV